MVRHSLNQEFARITKNSHPSRAITGKQSSFTGTVRILALEGRTIRNTQYITSS
jgi:hypothetical protein